MGVLVLLASSHVTGYCYLNTNAMQVKVLNQLIYFQSFFVIAQFRVILS